jgi:hypothetical protein
MDNLLMRALLFILLSSCMLQPLKQAPLPPECPQPFEPWIAGCEKALGCGMIEAEYVHVCHACVQFWITINDQLEKVEAGSRLRPSISCDTLREESTNMGIVECYAWHVEVLKP